MMRPFEVRRDENFAADDPLLSWAEQSHGFATFAGGRTVHFLRCPNLRARPNLEEKLQSLAQRLDPTETPAPVVVVDHSREGAPLFKVRYYHEMIHQFAAATGLPLGNIVYASQNRLGAEHHAALMEQRREAVSYRWLTFDHHLQRTIDFHRGNTCRHERPPTEAWDYTFLCMNRRPRPHRLVVLATLLNAPFRELSLASFSWNRNRREFLTAVAAATSQFPSRSAAIAEVAARLDQEPIHLPGDDEFERKEWLHDVPSTIAARAAMTIVTETHFTDGSTLRITEKTLKPILCRHPFILVGEYRSLALLESWGFDVDFAGIDRSYDEIRDPAARMEAVLGAIGDLAAPPDSPKVRRLVDANRERTEFNRRHLLHSLKPVLYEEAERCAAQWPAPSDGWLRAT